MIFYIFILWSGIFFNAEFTSYSYKDKYPCTILIGYTNQDLTWIRPKPITPVFYFNF